MTYEETNALLRKIEPEKLEVLVAAIVELTIDEFFGRHGFGQLWEALDEDTAEEIRASLHEEVRFTITDFGAVLE